MSVPVDPHGPPARASGPRQLTLDLPFEEGYRLTDFLPAASNRAALDAVLRWPDWPAPALLLDGPPGCGKTHLARIWAERADAAVLDAADLTDAPATPRLAGARAVVVEHADEVADEAALFHLYNAVAGRPGHLLLTARQRLAAWPLALPDLRSRLATAWQVAIEPPDDGLLAAVLVKQLADRQLRVDAEVVSWLVSRMERAFPAARRIVTALDKASLRARRPITVALAREVLAGLVAADAEAGAAGEAG